MPARFAMRPSQVNAAGEFLRPGETIPESCEQGLCSDPDGQPLGCGCTNAAIGIRQALRRRDGHRCVHRGHDELTDYPGSPNSPGALQYLRVRWRRGPESGRQRRNRPRPEHPVRAARLARYSRASPQGSRNTFVGRLGPNPAFPAFLLWLQRQGLLSIRDQWMKAHGYA